MASSTVELVGGPRDGQLHHIPDEWPVYAAAQQADTLSRAAWGQGIRMGRYLRTKVRTAGGWIRFEWDGWAS